MVREEGLGENVSDWVEKTTACYGWMNSRLTLLAQFSGESTDSHI